MAGEAQDRIWPIPKSYFTVHFESLDNRAAFQEVSGLEIGEAGIEIGAMIAINSLSQKCQIELKLEM